MEKIILLGTPTFSVLIFEEIIKNFNVVAIVSQPDRPANRGYATLATPTKVLGQKYNIPVLQPSHIDDIYEELKAFEPDIILSCAFGQIISKRVLELPKIRSLNIHGSLLPKYRGASPVQYALLNNDAYTGITLMQMVYQMDAGDIIFQAKTTIDIFDTADSLFDKLGALAVANITPWLKKILANNYSLIPQDLSKVIYSPKLRKENAELKSTMTKEQAFNLIRAYSSNPGAFIFLENKRLKVYYASEKQLNKNALELKFANGKLYALDYQFESKKRVRLL